MVRGRNLAAVITDGFHNSELTDPKKALEKAGAKVSVIGVKPEHRKIGVYDHITWRYPEDRKPEKGYPIDALIEEVKADSFDGLLIAGGFSPERLRAYPPVIEFVRKIYAQGKPIAAICHGGQLLISAGIVRGKTMTCVQTIAVDLMNAGAIYLDEALVVDGNIITSRTPDDMATFIEGLMKALSF